MKSKFTPASEVDSNATTHAHFIVCRRVAEIETIYRSHQDLLCNIAVIPRKRSLRRESLA
jgi:hypothetical protein